jgi:hypothetical protein
MATTNMAALTTDPLGYKSLTPWTAWDDSILIVVITKLAMRNH